MAVYGLLRISLCLQQSFTQRVVRDSFEQVGIEPYSPEQMKKQFRGDLSREDELTLNDPSIMKRLARLMVKQGEIYDRDYDALGLFLHDTDRVDGKVISGRRLIILTNKAFIKKRFLDKEKAEIEAEAAKKAREAKKALTEAKKVEAASMRERKEQISSYVNRQVISMSLLKQIATKI
jgi:hypothetical protein